MSVRALAACQCSRWSAESGACRRTATAEDLRCDVCRIGCRRVQVDVAAGAARAHVVSPAALARAAGHGPRSRGREVDDDATDAGRER